MIRLSELGGANNNIGGGGHVIKDEGTALTQRANLNFVGAGVVVTDDVGSDASIVTIANTGGVSPQGAWNSATAYVIDDLVEYQGSAYIANANNTNIVPDIGAQWTLYVSKGTDGASGTAGTVSATSGITLEHIATPDAPAAGNTIVYAKTDSKLYFFPSGGAETEVGSGTAGGGGSVSTIDIYRYSGGV